MFGLEVLTRKALCFLLQFIDKTVKKFFVIKCKLILSLMVDLFISKLKTKFNNLFHRMILNTIKNL